MGINEFTKEELKSIAETYGDFTVHLERVANILKTISEEQKNNEIKRDKCYDELIKKINGLSSTLLVLKLTLCGTLSILVTIAITLIFIAIE